jgi:hypothetical protein
VIALGGPSRLALLLLLLLLLSPAPLLVLGLLWRTGRLLALGAGSARAALSFSTRAVADCSGGACIDEAGRLTHESPDVSIDTSLAITAIDDDDGGGSGSWRNRSGAR